MNVSTIFARARTVATQAGGIDANQSAYIDAKGGLKALLPHVILYVYREKAKNPKFLRDITTKKTITITSGTGTLTTDVMKEYLGSADFADDNGSLITYFDYAVDFDSGQTFDQLGYAFLIGSTISYTAPSPNNPYTGNLFITVPCTPTVTTTVTFPSEETANDVILTLALALQDKVRINTFGEPNE